MFTIHATQKLRDRVKAPLAEPVEVPSTALGNWYATPLFWKPQVALFANEATLVPVLVPLAPAKTLVERFPDHLESVLHALGIDPRFVAAEVAATVDARWAKTANRSVVGITNEFSFLSEVDRAPRAQRGSRVAGGLPHGHAVQPALQAPLVPRELAALVATHLPE